MSRVLCCVGVPCESGVGGVSGALLLRLPVALLSLDPPPLGLPTCTTGVCGAGVTCFLFFFPILSDVSVQCAGVCVLHAHNLRDESPTHCYMSPLLIPPQPNARHTPTPQHPNHSTLTSLSPVTSIFLLSPPSSITPFQEHRNNTATIHLSTTRNEFGSNPYISVSNLKIHHNTRAG